MHYDIMDEPDIPLALMQCALLGERLEMMDTRFSLGRETLLPKTGNDLRHRRKLLFIAMFLFIAMLRNAGSATSFFKTPSNRVVELGAQIVF